MLNVVLPLAGKSLFFREEEYVFPKPLVEVAGKPMIQLVVENLSTITQPKKFIFILNSSDCSNFHLDSSVSLLADSCEILRIKSETAGATCSALMAIEHINNDDPLLIVNGDQVIHEDLNDVITKFTKDDVDAGVVCFESVHPRWSFARIDDDGMVVETAEKRPISKHAIAGFYYFKRGRDFVTSAMMSIRKKAAIGGVFYIAPVINEMILDNRTVGMYQIPDAKYHTFYAPQRIEEYEKRFWRA
ncbi:MAG: glycosyltransferase family 2 protein [Chlamydiales bacterium]|nr:glycosyltransferase family 2 protein [Chlamydiales bacterium]